MRVALKAANTKTHQGNRKYIENFYGRSQKSKVYKIFQRSTNIAEGDTSLRYMANLEISISYRDGI
jgi:hypothetical protein